MAERPDAWREVGDGGLTALNVAAITLTLAYVVSTGRSPGLPVRRHGPRSWTTPTSTSGTVPPEGATQPSRMADTVVIV